MAAKATTTTDAAARRSSFMGLKDSARLVPSPGPDSRKRLDQGRPMRSWELGIELDASSSLPMFLQIARSVTDGVRSGRLRPGDPLPGSRTLAGTLKVHRNTALAAYR